MKMPTVHPKRDRRLQPRMPSLDMLGSPPEAGEVVFRAVERNQRLVYVLRTPPDPNEGVFLNREEAIADALACAERRRTRAWVYDDGYGVRLLADFRVGIPLHTVLDRLRAEYREMPGLVLTRDQIQRMCGIERAVCRMALDTLVGEKFLRATPGGRYARLTDEPSRNAQPLEANGETGGRFARTS